MTRLLLLAGDAAAAEDRAALAWLQADGGYELRGADVATVAADDITWADVVWVHAGRHLPNLAPEIAAALRERVQHGGGMLLTLLATTLVVPLGLEQMPPNDVGERGHDDLASPPERGLQGWGSHPLFAGFVRGTDSWSPSAGERVAQATYLRPRWPVRGRVVGVERASLRLNADRAVAWEYPAAGGRVLCIGAHVHFATQSRRQTAQRDRLTRNALAAVARRAPSAPAWWPNPFSELPQLDPREVPLVPLGPALPDIASASTLTSVARADDPFTLAGRRALVVGGERAGIQEVWLHPMCVLADGLTLRVDEEIPDVRSVEVSPEQIVRHLQTRTRFIEERIFVPLHEPAVVVEYRYRRLGKSRADVEPPMLDVRMRLPLRLQSPMPAGALRPLRVTSRSERGLAAALVAGSDDHFRALLTAEGRVELAASAGGGIPTVAIAASLAEPMRLAFLGTVGGRAGLARVTRAVGHAGARALAVRRAEWARELQDEHLALRSPSSGLDTALEWAKVRLAACVASAPGIATGLMAGYGPAADAARQQSARFYGRDACWSALALLAAGMFAQARTALEFLAATQDVTGQVAHEVTTTGCAHYQAADTTPLFLRLAAAYLQWTGDAATLRQLWPSVVRALEYVLATDPEGDWWQDVESLAVAARTIGDEDVAARCALAVERGRAGVEREIVGAAADRPGWRAVEEFAAHRYEAAYRLLLANAMLCYERAKGAFDERRGDGEGDSHGADDRRSGAVPDRAWSAAMVVLPLVDGMLGAQPDAPAQRIRLTPHWPREWTHAVVGPLRIGDVELEMEAIEGCLVAGVPHDGVHYRLRVRQGGPLTVVLEHPVEGRTFERVRVDEAQLAHEECGTAECRHVRVTIRVSDVAEVQFVGEQMTGL